MTFSSRSHLVHWSQRLFVAGTLFASGVLALFLVSCSGDEEDYVELLSRAQDNVSYRAERLYECRYAGQDALETSRDLIVHDDIHHFLIRLLEIGGQTPDSNPDPSFVSFFNELDHRLQRGLGKEVVFLRDFRIRNAQLLLDNYSVRQVESSDSFLGRPTVMVRLDPVTHLSDRPSWILRMDRLTGLVVEYSELAPLEGIVDGERLTSRMVLQTLEYDPDTSSVSFPDFSSVSREKAPLSQIAEEVEFTLYEPTYLPAGFVLVSDHLLRDNQTNAEFAFDGTVVQSTFTDGVIDIVLFQHEPLEPMKLPRDVRGRPAIEIRIFEFGPLRMAELEVGGTYIHVVSKIGKESFEAFLESLAKFSG